MAEFRSLLERIHAKGLKVIIDLAPNHVSRAYQSTVRPDLNFGASDDSSAFFAPSNNFYYLDAAAEGGGPPLRLPTFDAANRRPISPTCIVQADCDGLFEGEQVFGRVTGNNRVTWTPDITDWYETVKLNYGYDFASGSPMRGNMLAPGFFSFPFRIPGGRSMQPSSSGRNKASTASAAISRT